MVSARAERTRKSRVNDILLSFSLQLGRLVVGCGVTVTFLFGLCSVFLASVFSGKATRKNFWSYRKNICARLLNGFVSVTPDVKESPIDRRHDVFSFC